MNIDEKVTGFIKSYDDWRGERLQELINIINSSATELELAFKWGVPVWTFNGMVCAVSGYKDHVKINFFKGAFLNDKTGVFNSGLESKEHRSINLAQADKVNGPAVGELVRQAVNFNTK